MTQAYSPADMMAVAMARLVKNGEVTFVGVNSPLPLVAVSLAKKLHAPDCIFVSISGGVNPSPKTLVANTSSSGLSEGSAVVFDNQELYGLNGRGGIDATFLGMGQMDVQGRVNSSFIGSREKPKVRFPGGGGAPAILPMAKRVIVWRAGHSPKIFVEKVEFVTSAGNVDRVVTPFCVFRKESGRLVLESIHPGITRQQLADSTGFKIANLDSAPETPEPTLEELSILREIDSGNVRRAEFGPM
jgi:glutaconate CoA-transferase subunit B